MKKKIIKAAAVAVLCTSLFRPKPSEASIIACSIIAAHAAPAVAAISVKAACAALAAGAAVCSIVRSSKTSETASEKEREVERAREEGYIGE